MRLTQNFNSIIRGANSLSLGISIVVAVFLGVIVGRYLENLTGLKFLFWLFTFFGICAAILNVYKAYQIQMKEAKKIEQEYFKKNLKKKDDTSD